MTTTVDADKVDTVLLCSGRITWDLMVERKKREGDEPTTAIVRVEQLYPRPVEELKAELGGTRTSRRSAGCRTSRRTWARGRTTR